MDAQAKAILLKQTEATLCKHVALGILRSIPVLGWQNRTARGDSCETRLAAAGRQLTLAADGSTVDGRLQANFGLTLLTMTLT